MGSRACYTETMRTPVEVIEQLWEMDRALLEHQEAHGPAVDTARALWQFLSLPVYAPPQVMEDAWTLGRSFHEAILAAIPQGPEAVFASVKAVFATTSHEINPTALKGFIHLNDIIKQPLDQFTQAPPPPLTQSEQEDARWLCARLAPSKFRYLALSPYWIRDHATDFTSSCARLVSSLRADPIALSLDGQIGLRLASADPCDPHVRGSFNAKFDEISIFKPQACIFSHEWMHALENIAWGRHDAAYAKIHKALDGARASLRTMSQDHLSARRTINQAIERAAPIMEESLQWFLLNRAAPEAAAALAPHGKVDKGFLRDFMHTLASIGDNERRTRAVQSRLSAFLAPGQAPISEEGASDIAALLKPSAFAFSQVARGISAFQINARVLDKSSQVGPYWAQPSEMLARAAQCYTMGHAVAEDVLAGSEYAQLMQSMEAVASEVRALFPAHPEITPRAPRRGSASIG